MRKWHRWLAVMFGIFTLVIAITGLLIHATDLLKGDDHDRPAQAAAASAKPAFTCPPDYTCRPKPKDEKGGLNFAGLVKHIHSGEIAGPFGTVLSILTGCALLFFSISGMWMYFQLWTNRRTRKLAPRWFWK